MEKRSHRDCFSIHCESSRRVVPFAGCARMHMRCSAVLDSHWISPLHYTCFARAKKKAEEAIESSRPMREDLLGISLGCCRHHLLPKIRSVASDVVGWKDYVADVVVDAEWDGRYSVFVKRNQCSEREYHTRIALRRMGTHHHRLVRCTEVEGHDCRVLLNPLQNNLIWQEGVLGLLAVAFMRWTAGKA